MLSKQDFKFSNRYHIAPYMACKTCLINACAVNKANLMPYYLGNEPIDEKWCDLSLDTRIKLIVELREQCPSFCTETPIERDTTYPGHTYAPHDNNDPSLKRDSSDIDYNPDAPTRCINHEQFEVAVIKANNWDDCLKKLFDRKRCDWTKKDESGKIIIPTFAEMFPDTNEVLRLLGTSRIPEFGFRIGQAPQKSMGFDRGLWFYHSAHYNFSLAKNRQIKGDMKKIMMVYLYNVWFKQLPQEKQFGIFLSLFRSDNYSLARDLAWWMFKTFKEPVAILAIEMFPPEYVKGEYSPDYAFIPDPKEDEIEFIPMSLLDKAMEAKMLAETDCNTNLELDLEVQQYEQMINRLGYNIYEDTIEDRDGKVIY